jgi:histidine triad (HIT) family protein
MPSLFSRIARHELPAHLVYEDDHAVAFLDIHPRTEGHTLVVPRHEVAEFHALPAEEAAHLVQALRTVAAAVTRAMGTPHYNLSLNNGSAAGQVVFHVHFHIIPRREGEPFPRGRLSLTAERMEEIAAAIRAAVAEGGALFE